MDKDRQAFYDYIFEEIKPTIIHHRGSFTARARFDEDPRFERDYVPINEREDLYASRKLKRKVLSGNYIRKDAIIGKEDKVLALREGRMDD